MTQIFRMPHQSINESSDRACHDFICCQIVASHQANDGVKPLREVCKSFTSLTMTEDQRQMGHLVRNEVRGTLG